MLDLSCRLKVGMLLLSSFSRVRTVRPHRWQPTRLLCPWDSPGKNTGVGCHFFLQCVTVKFVSEVAQSCPTLSDPMDRSLPGSSIHGVFQAGVLEWVAFAFSKSRDDWIVKWLKAGFDLLKRSDIASVYFYFWTVYPWLKY